MYCKNCGKQIDDKAFVCPNCGVKVESVEGLSDKSKIVAGLLGIFLGVLGIHNFYLGYTTKAVIQLLLGTVGACLIVGPMISGIWGFIEGIMILMGNVNDVDGKKLQP